MDEFSFELWRFDERFSRFKYLRFLASRVSRLADGWITAIARGNILSLGVKTNVQKKKIKKMFARELFV